MRPNRHWVGPGFLGEGGSSDDGERWKSRGSFTKNLNTQYWELQGHLKNRGRPKKKKKKTKGRDG